MRESFDFGPRTRRALAAAALLSCLASSARAPAQSVACGEWVSENGIPGVNGAVRAFATIDDGSGRWLVLGGDFTRAGKVDASRVVLSDGDTFIALGSGDDALRGTVNALAVFDDGSGLSIFAGGAFDSTDGSPADFVARWDGSRWVDVGGGLDGEVNDLAAYDDGSGLALYAAGAFVTAGGIPANRVARWDGSAWTALGNGMYQNLPRLVTRVSALEPFDDGSGRALYAAGAFVYAGSVVCNSVARWDGAAWSAVGGGVDGAVHAMAVFEDAGAPALVVGGEFAAAGGVAAARVALFDGAAWRPLAEGTDDAVRALTTYDFGAGRSLYVGGLFRSAGGTQAIRVARWDGIAWSPIDLGSDRDVLALLGFDLGRGPRLFVGGSFSFVSQLASRGVAAWTGAAFEPFSSGLVAAPRAIAAHEEAGSAGEFYVGGDFFRGMRDPRARFLARQEGDAWVPLGLGVNGPVEALASLDDGTGPALYAGGEFTMAGAIAAHRIARWRDGRWSRLGAGLPGLVRGMFVFDDGTGPALYAFGDFDSSLARWDGAVWRPAGGARAHNPHSATVFDDGTGPAIYVGGTFTTIGGQSIRYMARWDGAAWSSVGGGVGNRVYATIVHDDGSGPALYAGGEPDLVPGGGGIARFDGSAWTPVGAGVFRIVYSLATLEVGGESVLVAGGDVDTAGGAVVRNLAYWDGRAWAEFGEGYPQDVLEMTTFPARTAGRALVIAGHDTGLLLARWQDHGAGTVNAGAGLGRVAEVLFVNDSPGGADRTIEAADSEPFALSMAAAPAGGGESPFALYVWSRGPAGPADWRALPKGFGVACLPTPLSGGGSPRPIAVWNNTGYAGLGAPTLPSSPAPTIVASRPSGVGRRGTFFFQGVIADPNSAGQRLASVTNGITLISR